MSARAENPRRQSPLWVILGSQPPCRRCMFYHEKRTSPDHILRSVQCQNSEVETLQLSARPSLVHLSQEVAALQ
jgi:hypothetical protein